MVDPFTFAVQLARQTGDLLLTYFSLMGTGATAKPDNSVVTSADLAADHLITQAIQANFPQDALLSEELNPSTKTDTQAIWVVDPLDGTTNFSLGLHYWGVSIARLVNGFPDLAVLFFPLVDELYTSKRGQGAELNHKPIHVKPPTRENPASFFSCCSRTHRYYKVTVPYKARILGSTAYSLCCVARGAAVLSFEATAKIWDIAAGWLLVEEAGGCAATLDGSEPFPIRPGMQYATQTYPTLGAATENLMAKAHQQIRPGPAYPSV